MKFNEPLEGRCNFMYLDVKGLVTTGVGNLIDPVDSALSLPWYRPDMYPASPDEIRQAWNAVKARPDLRLRGGVVYKGLTSLRLMEGAIDALVLRRLDQMANYVRQAHPDCTQWPADAQLAVLSMCWALGPAFQFTKFWQAMKVGDFITAATESHITGAGTITLRNLANKLLLVNAARTTMPGTLSWPKVLGPPTP